MQVHEAKPYARGIDTVIALDSKKCNMLVRYRFDFVVRYLWGSYAITREELQCILCSGLAVMLVTPSRLPGWEPSTANGTLDGNRTISAIEDLFDLSVPENATIWLDFEGTDGPKKQSCEYIDAWSSIVRDQEVIAGLYVGANPGGLGPQDLWERPNITRYWRSGSRVPEPANRGWCMQQLRPLDTFLNNLKVDHNVIERDFKGSLPTWIVA